MEKTLFLCTYYNAMIDKFEYVLYFYTEKFSSLQ